MRFHIDVLDPIPPWINRSYGDYGFWNFGLCAWDYDGYLGETEWINVRQFCTEPKYDNPSGLKVWMKKDVIYVINSKEVSAFIIPPVVVDGAPVDPFTGQGLPLFLQNF